jgi:hypothetical protein
MEFRDDRRKMMGLEIKGNVEQAMNVESGGTGTQNQFNNVPAGNEAELLRQLAKHDLSSAELTALQTALHEDREDNGGLDPAEPGHRVTAWLATVSNRVGSVSGKLALAAGGGVVAGLVKSYFGVA